MSPIPIDVLWFVEHVGRELEAASAVAEMAHARGIRIEVRSIVFDLPETLSLFEPRIVAIPFMRNLGRPSMASTVVQRWPGATFIDLAYEQFFSNWTAEFKAPVDSFVQRHAVHVAWGEEYARYLRDHGVEPSNIRINGHPGWGLLLPPYADNCVPREELARRHGLDADARWVFVPENYAWAFMRDRALRSYIQQGRSLPQGMHIRSFMQDSLATVLGWLRSAVDAGDCQVVLRPRPSTPKPVMDAFIRKTVGKLPEGFLVTKDLPMRDWLLASDGVASSASTTLLEAAVAGRPAVVLAPYPFLEDLRMPWMDLAPAARSAQEFSAFARDPATGRSRALETYARSQALAAPDPLRGLVEILQHELRGATGPPSEAPPERREALASVAGGLAPVRGFRVDQAIRALPPRVARRLIGWFNMHEGDRFTPQDVARKRTRFQAVLDTSVTPAGPGPEA